MKFALFTIKILFFGTLALAAVGDAFTLASLFSVIISGVEC